MARTSRRALLSTGATAALASIAAASALPAIAAEAAPAACPDAELIAICDRSAAIDQEWQDIYGAAETVDDDDECDRRAKPLIAERRRLLDRMSELYAATPDGVHARARALAAHNGRHEHSFDTRNNVTGRLLSYLMRDAAALETNAPAVVLPPSPDAELIGLCAQIIDLERQWDAEGKKNAHTLPNDPTYKPSIAEQARLHALQEPIFNRIYEMPTHTLAGFRARGKAIMAADYGEMQRNQDHQGQLYSLMHDLAEMGEG